MNTKSKMWQQLGEAFQGLDPEMIAQSADRPISLALVAEDAVCLREMEDFIAPPSLGARKAQQVRERYCSFVLPVGKTEQEGLQRLDLVISSEGAADQISALFRRFYVFSPDDPQQVVKSILKDH